METKITHLRNLMTPLINYFKMVEKNINNDKLLKDSIDQSIKAIPEIRSILNNIPDDACDINIEQEIINFYKWENEYHEGIKLWTPIEDKVKRYLKDKKYNKNEI